MDSFTLTHLVNELREQLHHGLVEKVQPVSPVQLVFKFRRGHLLISADDQHPSLYLMRKSRKRSIDFSSSFLLLVRKHLVGSRLEGVKQVDYDRIVHFQFASRNELGGSGRSTLVVELIDRRANLYLLDAEDRVMNRLIARPKERQSIGTHYAPPQQRAQLVPETLTETQFQQFILSASSLHQGLLENIKGFSPLMAQEVVWRAYKNHPYVAFTSVIQDVLAPPEPRIYSPVPLEQVSAGEIDWQRELILSPIDLHWASEAAGLMATKFATILEATEHYEEEVEAIRMFQTHQRTVDTAVQQKIKKTRKRLERLREDMERLGDYERDRRYGDLLLSNRHQAQRGKEGFRVTDYYDPEQPQIEIPAADHLTPPQAAQVYFERYRKHKKKSAALQQQIAELENNLARLDEVAERVKGAVTIDALIPWADEALGRPLTLATKSMPEKKLKKIPGVLQFVSSEQHQILVGRSADANQRLTFQLARPHDVWLHAADYPGSHVILRKAKGTPLPYRSLVEAAELAAFYSQARQSGKVVVHYTERKYVHKIPGAAPGLVRLADFKSIAVEPRIEVTRVEV